ncbi:MAG: DDE-type integrase/transposase/recombinase, partial [Acidimicrobiia bacterium]|nr:DDE-type integrase/transposase/recombinase [Acidimicrobiia bacterium]
AVVQVVLLGGEDVDHGAGLLARVRLWLVWLLARDRDGGQQAQDERGMAHERPPRGIIPEWAPLLDAQPAVLTGLFGIDQARPRRPFRPRTTQPDHAASPSPNRLHDAPPPQAPGRQIVSDITYIPTREGWLDLAVVIDLFSRGIIGWKLADSMPADLVIGALRQALRTGLENGLRQDWYIDSQPIRGQRFVVVV